MSDGHRETEKEKLREKILELAEAYAALAHAPSPFEKGTSPVPVSGKVLGAQEMRHLVDSALDFWLTTGRFNDAFEAKLASILGCRFALTCNSGSSANLIALTSLTTRWMGDRRLRPGDEIITCATGFPTTVNPILQNQMLPVFVDVDLPTYNIRADAIEAAITPKTRGIMVAHALGNPFDLDTVMALAKKHQLYVIEDCCDALGAEYDGKWVGRFGDVGTLSFYPAHHITMGEGGAVFTQDSKIKRAMESVRDWGRDCYCAPGQDNTCQKRFGWKLGDLPFGYDHKYAYSTLGYNLKITDMQASVGLAQLERLNGFISKRRENFQYLWESLKPLEEFFILPQATPKSKPSWFGFLLTVREGAPFTRNQVTQHLSDRKIGTRLLFGGNLVRQPYMAEQKYRISGTLENSDRVMNDTFWVGVYPGLEKAHLDYVVETLTSFVLERSRESRHGI